MAAALAAMTTLAGPVGAAAPASETARVPRSASPLEWERCGGGFQCATLTVPVDDADPGAGDVPIAVTRRPADDPDSRVGSLVVNYGGPGDAGTETIRFAADSMPPEIRRRFDIVSFDPRGTGRSRPVDCVDDETFERAWSEDPTPNGLDELPDFYDGTSSGVDLVAECISNHGDWLARVGTRNVARDLDRLREALGDPKLNFLGYSYGTVIGAVYAQEFPQRIRSMVLDSAVDLSASMARQQLDNAAGFEAALDEFLADCAPRKSCAFRSDGDPMQALEELRGRFESGSKIAGNDDREVGVSEFYTALLTALYSPSDWSFLADALHRAAVDDDGSGLQILSDIYAGRRDDGTYTNLQEVIGVVVCDDQPEPVPSFDEFRASYAELTRDYPFFGAVLGGSPLGCDPRLPAPHADEVLGDVQAPGAPPVLVIGTTKDPATPYAGAQDLQDRIAGSRLVTVDGTRHGSYATGNTCVDGIVDRYLIALRVPKTDPRCSSS
jgi:pimeloyl-ACP methyl ester carboxylesterase